jgi:caffeoyl-CoA O-methyltransferase
MTLHFPVAVAAVVAVASLGVPPPDRGDRTGTVQAQAAAAGHDQAALDARVKRFLAERARSWRDMNVPASDGQLLHDLIVEHGYTRALEIGTSTGHSGIWIAWALSKTGGRLITVEIDERRHRQALANFEAAGVLPFIDARLGNAHEIVPALEGPFDFVFSDADKDWYPNYFKAVFPKLTVGGCYTTHNITERGRGAAGSRDYLALLRATPGAETTVDERGGGMAITFKREAGR